MSKIRNKLVFSFFVVGGFIVYSILQGFGRLTGQSVGIGNQPKLALTSASSAPVGKFRDGVYTGVSTDAYYGNVQVQVTIQSGQIAKVQFLDYPHDQRNSQNINSQAIPYLQSEAIAAQSANVNIVSGATETSQAFIQSLQSALSQA